MERTGIQGTYPNIIKAIYSKPIVIPMEKTLNNPTKIWDKARLHTLSLFIQYSALILARAIRQQKEVKEIQTGKEESLFADDKIVNIAMQKNSTRELLHLINNSDKVASYKTNSK